MPEEMAKEEGIAEALETMLYSNDNQEYREAMTSYEMAERDRVSDLEATAKKNLEKGREEEARTTVLRMFNRSYDIAIISDLTGLSLEKVQAIIDSIAN